MKTSDSVSEEGHLEAPRLDRLIISISAIAVVGGIVLRFTPRSGMWLDEALSTNIASLPLGEIGGALRHDGHPPLYYVLLHYWGALGGESDWWLRSLSGLFSILTLPLLYLAGCRVAGRRGAGPLGVRRTGLITLAVGAAMPFGVRYATETRMYSLVILLCAVGYLLVDDLLQARRYGRARWATAAATALIATALLWTHYWSLWLLAAVGVLALWRAWRGERSAERSGAVVLIGALIVAGLLYIPWLPTMAYQAAHTGTPWGDSYGPVSVVVVSLVDFAGAKHGIAQFLTYVLVPLVLIAFVVRIVGRSNVVDGSNAGVGIGEQDLILGMSPTGRVSAELFIVAATLAIGWAAATASGNTFSSRYASVIYPLFLIVVGVGISVLRRTIPTAVVLAIVVSSALFGAVGGATGERSQNGSIAQVIADDAAKSGSPAVVMACPDQLGVSLQRELKHRAGDDSSLADVIPYPTAGPPERVDWVDYRSRNLASTPEKFLAKVDGRLAPDATVYLVASAHYRTFEGKCDGLIDLLGANRTATHAVDLDTSGLDESADLWIFRPT